MVAMIVHHSSSPLFINLCPGCYHLWPCGGEGSSSSRVSGRRSWVQQHTWGGARRVKVGRRVCGGEEGGGVQGSGDAAVAMSLWYEGNSVRYGGVSGFVDQQCGVLMSQQSEVHLDVHVRGPSMLVFSGGTAFNGVVEELKKWTTRVSHVLPVSDDGGSTAEIVRVVGGPAVGDIRSRCLRLSSDSSVEALAVKRLLGHRLSSEETEAKAEWYEIVEGEHQLWDNVSGPYRETIRAFLVHFQCQILLRSVDKFSFRNGSIGNFFFAGARIFFQSLDAAIFLYSRVSHIPTHSLVLPAISTNDRLTLGCELLDGTVIKGQNAISHPTVNDSMCRTSVVKTSSPLPSPIKRIFYMSSEGNNIFHEVFPAVNPAVVEQLSLVDAIVYGMGSLYTSICPSLVLRGVGETIAARSCLKVMILNSTYDRETFGMPASAFVASITDALNRTFCDSMESRNCDDPCPSLDHSPSDYITVMLVPEGGDIKIDVENLTRMGIARVVTVDSTIDEKLGRIYEPKALIGALQVEIAMLHSHGSR